MAVPTLSGLVAFVSLRVRIEFVVLMHKHAHHTHNVHMHAHNLESNSANTQEVAKKKTYKHLTNQATHLNIKYNMAAAATERPGKSTAVPTGTPTSPVIAPHRKGVLMASTGKMHIAASRSYC